MNEKRVIPKVGPIKGDGLSSAVVPQLARLEAERIA